MPSESKLYIGDLARDTTKKDLEHAFGYYGQLVDVWMPRNSSGFAFVEFEDSRDAADAVKNMDGAEVCGGRIRVEFSSDRRGQQRSRSGGFAAGGRGRGRRFNRDDKCYACGEHGHYAYDCHQGRGGGGGGGGGARGGRRRTSRSRSRSRSPRYGSRRSYSRSRSRSRSPDRYRRSSPRYEPANRIKSPKRPASRHEEYD